MATETQTRTAVCPTLHGTVEAIREMPKAGFPYVIKNAVHRTLAARHPYRSHYSGEAVLTD